MPLHGLNHINIELSSRCDKNCGFCGHQDPSINTSLTFGDMPLGLLRKIRDQLPPGIIVQFHRDGEPLMYPALGIALELFDGFITSIVTNGKQLVSRAEELIDNCTTITVSAFHGDPDGPAQLDTVAEFLRLKGTRAPMVNIKFVGGIDLPGYRELGVPILTRALHVPEGDIRYAHRDPTIPEVGICLSFLSQPSVDWRGHLYICNRLDPNKGGYLGDLTTQRLDHLWNSTQRQRWLEAHKRGLREEAAPLCRTCLFYGVPTPA